MQNGTPLWQWPASFPTGVAGSIPVTVALTAFNTNLHNPYTQEWNLTLERQIEQTAFRLQYVGNKSTSLYWYEDLNLPEARTQTFTNSRRPYPQYGSITNRANRLRSSYPALHLR